MGQQERTQVAPLQPKRPAWRQLLQEQGNLALPKRRLGPRKQARRRPGRPVAWVEQRVSAERAARV
ncbi:MAG: hypothetical protein H8K05_15100 [Nitrospira sp.]|nr:hypothetical protein [Nitrospira sp.]